MRKRRLLSGGVFVSANDCGFVSDGRQNVEENEPPRLILTSESVGRAYLAFLDGLGISWIACGRDRVALARALEFLTSEFGVKRAAVVGGGRINKGFLEAASSTK